MRKAGAGRGMFLQTPETKRERPMRNHEGGEEAISTTRYWFPRSASESDGKISHDA
jgi:hypothetical protein